MPDEMKPSTAYLGDGVYASVENGMIALRTDGNVVWLEPEVYAALVRYVDSLKPGSTE